MAEIKGQFPTTSILAFCVEYFHFPIIINMHSFEVCGDVSKVQLHLSKH